MTADSLVIASPTMPLSPDPKASTEASTNGTGDDYVRLRDMILSEQVMPNERLVEQEYALRFGTNRSNIRKALVRLEQDGLVVLEPFRGAHVRRITASEAVEMFEIRGELEVMLMPHVVERATGADKAELLVLADRMREAARAKDANAVALASRALREALWRISGHATAMKLRAGFNIQLVRNWYRTSTLPGRADAISEQLCTVVDAICEASAGKASKAMRRYHDAAVANLKLGQSMDTLPLR
jgi:DNA-binding GntR family transcriptional regulator